MDGHTSNSKKPPSPTTLDLDRFLAIPAIWTPEMSEGEWQEELSKMLFRSRLTHDFCQGFISPDDFMDGLNDVGVDVYSVEDAWSEGVSFLT